MRLVLCVNVLRAGGCSSMTHLVCTNTDSYTGISPATAVELYPTLPGEGSGQHTSAVSPCIACLSTNASSRSVSNLVNLKLFQEECHS